MLKPVHPPGFPKPASNYVQGMVHRAGAERLVISGQIGVDGEGKAVAGLEPQMRRAWDNLLAVVKAAGFAPTDIVKVTVYVTMPALAEFRRAREAALPGHAPAATYVQVAALASPDYLVEIEGEAVKG